jgi:flagellar hook-associated protein 3 FlgL
MIRTVQADAERFLSALETSRRRYSTALSQLSTGYRVAVPSDSPVDVMDIIRLNSRIAHGESVAVNLTLAKSEAEIVDTTLQTGIELLEGALQIGAQGTDSMLDATSRQGLAQQVQQIHQQIYELTRLNVQGRYVFSGDRDQEPQYTLDPANTATGVNREFVAGESRAATDLLGGVFQTGMSAQDVFDHRNADDTVADDNVFAALASLTQALQAGDSDAVIDAVSKIKLSLDHMNSALTFYGGVQNRIASSAALIDKYQLQWKQALSDRRDADAIAAVTELETAQTQQSAAMSARAKFSQRSLFDFLS